VFEAWQVEPRLDRWAEMLNVQYLPLFGSTTAGLEFDYDSVVRTDREGDALELQAKATAAQVLVDSGYDPAAVLETVGLPDMPIAEKATQQPQIAPPGWVMPGTPGSGAPPAPSVETAQDLVRRLVALAGDAAPKAVLPGRVSRHAIGRAGSVT
jgi:hypothetical protein